MVGGTSEIMEPSQNINELSDVNIKEEPLFTLKTDNNTENINISNDETQFLFSNIIPKTEVEEESENESNTLERYIIVEEAVEEVTTTYDEHILEICQEENNMDTDHYEDFGYESLSSPEYDYKTQYTPQIFTKFPI